MYSFGHETNKQKQTNKSVCTMLCMRKTTLSYFLLLLACVQCWKENNEIYTLITK